MNAMKRLLITVGVVIALLAGILVLVDVRPLLFLPTEKTEQIATSTSKEAGESLRILTDDLSVPWGVDFLPDGNLLVTERTGTLLEIARSGEVVASSTMDSVEPTGEGGLLGVAVHPNFSNNQWIYVYETYDSGGGTRNRVVRYRYGSSGTLHNQVVIVDEIPGASYHDGGRIAFSPEGYLFITTGDAGSTQLAQSTSTLAGKILRLQDDGSVPAENSYNNAIYSYGHRNPQGLAWDNVGRLWSTEHGRSGRRSGLDEINLIKTGGNYGWPYLEGDETCNNDDIYAPTLPSELAGNNCNALPPMVHSGPDVTWAPASLAAHQRTFFFGGLRGQAIYTASLQSNGTEVKVSDVTAHFKEEFGRVRTVVIGPNERFMFVTTSNTDGRGNPDSNDDKIIRIPLSAFQ